MKKRKVPGENGLHSQWTFGPLTICDYPSPTRSVYDLYWHDRQVYRVIRFRDEA